MDDDRLQKENPLLYVLFIIAGIALILLSFLLRARDMESVWVDLCLNVGATLVSTAVIAFLYQRFGKNSLVHYIEELLKHFSITRKSMELGLQDIWRERRHVPNDMWNTFTGAARSQVWLFGIAELGFAEDPTFRKLVAEGVSKGCNYRFLLLDPDSDAAATIDEREGGGGQVQGRIRRALARFDEMQKSSKKKGKVELRVFSDMPQVSIVRADDELLVTPYLSYSPGGNSCFTFRVLNISSGIFAQYVRQFDETWACSYPPKL
jgi:hypothetical protein